MAILVFDIGGTFTKFGVWENETLMENDKFETPSSWITMKSKLRETKEHFETFFNLEGVGFSVPGAPNKKTRQIEGESLVEYLHYFPIYDEIEEMLDLPIAIENDANCAAIAEMALGSAQGSSNVLFVIVGTGIGGTVIVNNEIVEGHNLYAGEIGFMLMNDEEENFGELATAVSMTKRYALRKKLNPENISGEEVFKLAEQGDVVAKEEVKKFFYYLTVGIYNLTAILNPEKIIIGGGVSNLSGFKQRVEKEWDELSRRIYHFPYRPSIEIATFKSQANLIGAVYNYKNIYSK